MQIPTRLNNKKKTKTNDSEQKEESGLWQKKEIQKREGFERKAAESLVIELEICK